MGRIIFICTLLGVAFAGVQLYREFVDKTGQETVDTLHKQATETARQATETAEQTRLISELLTIQKQLLTIAQDSVALSSRITQLEQRLAALEEGPSRSEIESQLDDLRRRMTDNEVRQDDLEYRLNDIAVELKRLGVDPTEYIPPMEPTQIVVELPTEPPLPTVEPAPEGPIVVLEAWDADEEQWVAEHVTLPEEDVCTTIRWYTDGIAEVFLEHVGHGPVPGSGEGGVGDRMACLEADVRGDEVWLLHVKLLDDQWITHSLVLSGEH